ncbi:MAG: branched-chain amino acid ABC transporter permease [Acidimicrobiales bacterium]
MLDQVVAGLAGGGVYALVGVCLVLAYRVGDVINFSQTFVGALAAYLVTSLVSGGMGPTTAVLVGILVGTWIAFVQGVVMAFLFAEAGAPVRTAVSIAMAISLFGITVLIYGDDVRAFVRMFDSIQVDIGRTRVTGISIVIIVSAVLLAAVLWLVVNRTRFGAVLRAVSARPTTAELLGVPTRALVILVWTVCGAISSAAVILVAPTRTNVAGMAMLVAPALAAALIGGLRSFGATVAAGIGLGILESMTLRWGTVIPRYRGLLPFVIVVVVLLWSQRKEQWSEAR